MARIYDGGGAGKTESQAELDLKALFEKKLDSSYTVIHSVPWIASDPKSRKPAGERGDAARLGCLICRRTNLFHC